MADEKSQYWSKVARKLADSEGLVMNDTCAMKPRDDATLRRILIPAEVAEYLHVSLATVQRLVRHGQIPAFRVGSEYRFYRDAIEKWMIDRQRID